MELFDQDVDVEVARQEIRRYPQRLREMKKVKGFYWEITLLSFASNKGKLDYVRMLLEEGADIHQADWVRISIS